ncbi:MAG: SDR family NAD(P)-dependent oxidoreductase, partial [Thermoactinospora sp.]|nr:SDR family NAD(P)-dependent oxidoreductase [Thermoactinospora sp.]
LHRDHGDRFLTALATAYAHGAPVQWDTLLDGNRIDLPTYPFQRQRFWLDAAESTTPDAAELGLTNPGHPLLGAAVTLPDSGGHLFTSRLSLDGHPWLAGHAVHDVVLLPGTAFVELALRAGDQVGCLVLEELTLQAPLTFTASSGVRLQVAVTPLGDGGRWKVAVYTIGDTERTLHASGVLAPDAPQVPASLEQWPPRAAEVDIDGLYDGLRDLGFHYGPAFQGLRRVWRSGEETFAEVELQDDADPHGFGLHPALFDAALHASVAVAAGEQPVTPMLPFAWSGVSLHATGATALRVRIAPHGPESFSVDLWDAEGAPVATVTSIAARPIMAGRLPGTTAGSLFRPVWKPVTTSGGNPPALLVADLAEVPHDVPPVVAVEVTTPPYGMAAAARATTGRVLSLLQQWLADERFAGSRLAVLTSDAAADPTQAAVWGLVRSAQAEHPDRFTLIDLDGDTPIADAVATGEPQLMIRAGEVWAPRLEHPALAGAFPALDPEGIVLVTGGCDGIGGLVARHLVAEHGVRRLVMVSRRGAAAPGAAGLAEEVERDGGSVMFAACDVSDREALAGLLAGLDRPLTAVIHAAGALDDGLIEAMTPERIDAVFRAKVDGAVHLHELTRELELAAFVLFSSVAGTFGAPGQGNYAAANVFLDALATRRRAEELPATSVAWGHWDRDSDLTGHLDEAGRRRLAGGGVLPLPADLGLALFDAAVSGEEGVLVAARLDLDAVSSPLLRDMVRGTRAASGRRSAARPDRKPREKPVRWSEQDLAELVREQVAAVLGHEPGTAVDETRPFKDLGFDSLAAVQLRNRLAAATGLRLPATLVFDHPTQADMIASLLAQLAGAAPTAVEVLLGELDRIDQEIDALPDRSELVTRMRSLLAKHTPEHPRGIGRKAVEAATDDEMFALIDNEIGPA